MDLPVRSHTDDLVAQLIEAQRSFSAAVGSCLTHQASRRVDGLLAAEALHERTLQRVLALNGQEETLAAVEHDNHAYSVLVRIGVLANAINRQVNWLSDHQLAQLGLEQPLDEYFRDIARLQASFEG